MKLINLNFNWKFLAKVQNIIAALPFSYHIHNLAQDVFYEGAFDPIPGFLSGVEIVT